MKISEMSTQKAAACLAELVAPMAVIVKNPTVKEYFEKAKNQEATPDLFADALSVLMPVFLRDHYNEVAKVLSILTGKTITQINDQPIRQTIADAKEVFDGDLVSFFS